MNGWEEGGGVERRVEEKVRERRSGGEVKEQEGE